MKTTLTPSPQMAGKISMSLTVYQPQQLEILLNYCLKQEKYEMAELIKKELEKRTCKP